MKIFRVQDSDGRGPWKPGFSHRWMDMDLNGRESLPPWPVEFGFGILKKVGKGEYVACGCNSMEQLWKWFTRAEMDRLHILGYHLFTMDADRILAESKNQLVFVRKVPLFESVEMIE